MPAFALRAVLLIALVGLLPAAETVWRQWRVVVDQQVSIASGGTTLCTLGSWPGTAELRDGAQVFRGVADGVETVATIRIADGVLQGRVSRRRDGKPAAGGLLFATFAAGDLAGTVVGMDATPVLVPKNYAQHELQHATEFRFFADQPAKRLLLRLDHGAFANLRDFRDHPGRNDMQLFLVAGEDGEVAFTLDLTSSIDVGRSERFPGERFAWQDDLHLFDPGRQPNRIPNPSFEAGLDEWGWGITDYADPPGREVWAIDDTVGHSGTRSARYTVAKGFKPRMLCSRAITVEVGRPVTISYWARTDQAGAGAHLFVWGATWGDFPVVRRDAYSAEWQRFSATLTPKNPFLRVCLGDHWWAGPAEQVDGAKVWFDDIQLEDGAAATPFSQLPMHALSDTGTAGQLVALGVTKPLSVRVHNTSAAPLRVATRVRIQDAGRHTVQESSFTSDLPAWGVASQPVALELGGVRGLLRVEMRLTADGETIVRHGRICVYEPIADAGRVRYGMHLEQPNLERIAALQPLGVSGSLGFSPLAEPALDRRMREAGWMHIVGTEAQGCPLQPYKARPDAATWAAFAAWFAPMAAAHPDQLWWKTFNEPNCGGYLATAEDLVAGVSLIRERVKAANPQALILTPDCYNASRQGQGWLESFLAAGGAKLVDAIAIHTYRARPEDPDLDGDIQALVAMKARFGLEKAPILFTEGEGYQRYTVPELGMSPLGFWEWRMGSLSKDLGRSELTAGALMARTLLACLKNAEQVKYYLSWTDSDVADVPYVTLASVNWLLARLRHATFVREFAIGDDLRAYLFTAPDRRAVAAVWSCSLPVDRGEQPGFNLHLALPPGTEVRDLMGNPLVAPDPLLINGRPTYLIGGVDSAAALASALEAAKADGLGTTVVDTTLRLDGAAGLAVTVRNRLPRLLQGELTVGVASKPGQTTAVALEGKAAAERRVSMPAVPANRVVEDRIETTFIEAGGALNRREDNLRRLGIPRLAKAVAIDGDAADWEGVPALELGANALNTWGDPGAWKGPADLSAKVRAGWREDGLYLLAEVTDDVHLQQGKSPEMAWQHDAMQFYLDLLADGRDRPGRGFDANDESLCISAGGGGTGRIWREYTPEWQVAFVKQGLVEAPCAVKRVGHVTTYELRLPPKEIFPLAMRPGTIFGCALIIGDADSQDRSKAVVTTPAGTEPHVRPELWPAAVLLP